MFEEKKIGTHFFHKFVCSFIIIVTIFLEFFYLGKRIEQGTILHLKTSNDYY